MRKTIAFHIVILFAISCLSLQAMADNPTSVENGKKPSGKSYTLKLEEDLRVGPDKDEDQFIWPGVKVGVTVNDKGHMFVFDGSGNRIVEIDTKGGFVRQIGQAGQGPGEFQALQSFQFLADGTSVAFENLQAVSAFTFFDQNMEYKDKKTHSNFGMLFQGAAYSPNGELLNATYVSLDQANQKMVSHFAVLDKELNVKHEVLQASTPSFNPAKISDPKYWTEFLSNQLRSAAHGKVGYIIFDGDNNFYTAAASKYEVTKWDPQQKKLLVFKRKYDPIPLTEAQIDAVVDPIKEAIIANIPQQLSSMITKSLVAEAVKMAEFPPVQNPIGGLNITDEGLVLVFHNVDFASDTIVADIFDKEGKYIGQFKHALLGMGRFIFRDGYAYTIETDEDDENYLVRYKYALVPAS